jgi:hypothetical protein
MPPPVKRNYLASTEPTMQGSSTTNTSVVPAMSSEWETNLASIPPSWIGPPNPNGKEGIPTIRIPYSYFFEKDREAKLAALPEEKMMQR